MKWISVKDNLPDDFDAQGQTKNYLVHIDNPFFKNGHLHVAYFERSPFGKSWRGIEPNVSHGLEFPNVTHWMPLPDLPIVSEKL